MTPLAPIALFAYRRPDHLRRAIESLAANPQACESDLVIYCDAAKDAASSADVARVLDVAERAKGFHAIEIVQRSENLGLSRSIAAGVEEQLGKAGRVIVVEDDLVLAPGFLGYMNRALDRYKNEASIWQVSGYMFPIERRSAACLLPFPTSWGWATWDRAWKGFSRDSSCAGKLRADEALKNAFNLDGAYDYFAMLESQLKGQIDSWAIFWHANIFFAGALVLYPPCTLVANGGFDEGATHKGAKGFETMNDLFVGDAGAWPMPDAIAADGAAYAAVRAFLLSRRPGWFRRLRRKVFKG